MGDANLHWRNERSGLKRGCQVLLVFQVPGQTMKTPVSQHVLLWMGATWLLSSASAQSRTSNACYSSGGDCGMHYLACEQGLLISVEDMHYGFKDRTTYTNHTCQALLTDCSAYVSRESCCGYNVSTDCLTPFSTEHREHVKECDGKVKCRVRATYVSGGCSQPSAVYGVASSFSVISYACVNSSKVERTTNQPVVCGPGCRSSTTSSMTSKGVHEDKSGKNDDKQKENDERMMQLIIGVSVGVGAGFIFLFTILIVCWIRIRRKPPDSMSFRSGPSMAPAVSLPRRPSKALTLTSTMPSSYYSSFLYSDTLPSSHPNSIYPESIYSVPADGSATGSIGPASLIRAHGYSNVEVPVPANSPGHLGRPPEVAERPSFHPASNSEGPAALPPQLPARPSILKPVTNREADSDKNMNGRCVVSTIQLSEGRSDSGASSSAHTIQKSLEGVQATQCSHCAKSSGRDHSSGLSTDDSSHRDNGGKVTRYKRSSKIPRRTNPSVSTDGSSSKEHGVLAHTRQAITSHPDPFHNPKKPHRNTSSSSSHKELWNPLRHARNSVQSDHTSEASSVAAVPEEPRVEGIPVSRHSQDKHDAVESWLGIVKPQVPF